MKSLIPNLVAVTLTVATGLSASAFAGEGGRLYVPLGSANAALIIDSGTDQPTGRIAGLPEAHGLALSPDGRTILAGSLMTGKPGTVPPKPTGMSEDAHNSHHSGGVTAGSGEISHLTLADAATGRILRRIPVPGAVHHVAIAPDGRMAAATHPSGGGISLVDLDKGEMTASVPTGPMPNYLAWSPDGKRLYVSNAGDGTVSELTFGHGISTRKLRAGGAPEHLVVSRDGERLYVNDADGGAVVELDLGAWKVARVFEIGGTLHGIDLSADESTLFVAARERNEIATVNLGDGAIARMPLGPEPYHLTVAPKTNKVYVSSAAESKIWALDAATLKVVSEIPIEGEGHQMAAW